MLHLPDSRLDSDTAYECGIVCARCVLEYHNKPLSFVDRLYATPNAGVSPDQLKQVFQLAGLRVAEGSWNVDQLKYFKSPFIAYVNAAEVGIDHYIVVRGISRSRVHYFDPAPGMTSCKVDEFLGRWHSVDGKGRQLVQSGMLVA